MNDDATAGLIAERIQTQAAKYMPNLTIENINFVFPQEDAGVRTPTYSQRDEQDIHLLGIELSYTVQGAGGIVETVLVTTDEVMSMGY